MSAIDLQTGAQCIHAGLELSLGQQGSTPPVLGLGTLLGSGLQGRFFDVNRSILRITFARNTGSNPARSFGRDGLWHGHRNWCNRRALLRQRGTPAFLGNG